MSRTGNRAILLAIALLFAVPLVLAALMRSAWWNFEPTAKVNAGRLLEPPVPLDLESQELQYPEDGPPAGGPLGRWWALYVLEGPCGQQCERDVTGLQRVHRAAGRHRERLGIALLQLDHADTRTRQLLAGLSVDGRGARGHAFLLDPAGNIILAYAPGFAPKDINQDLQRLLKWSAQGK